MPSNQDIKKVERKADAGLPDRLCRRGRQEHQKLKPYLILQYLLKYSDENNIVSTPDLIGYLEENCQIHADRRSIYRDIEEINLVSLMLSEEYTLEEAEDALAEDDTDDLKFVVSKVAGRKSGFYIRQRQYDLNDVRLLAECVYSAKFIDERRAKRLVGVVSGLVSEHQAKKIKHNVFLADRVKTDNTAVYYSVSTINDAMSTALDGKKHIPCKIVFQYLHYDIGNLEKQTARRKGEKYIVSPYQLIINDGNYYLLAFSEQAKAMRTYRIDRMKNVELLEEPREGAEDFQKIDLKTYTQRVFSMYGGKKERVTLRFILPLLDTAVERFGTKTAQYCKVDDRHFSVNAEVEISDQFFGWLLGFGKRVKLLAPDTVVSQFSAYLDKIRELY